MRVTGFFSDVPFYTISNSRIRKRARAVAQQGRRSRSHSAEALLDLATAYDGQRRYRRCPPDIPGRSACVPAVRGRGLELWHFLLRQDQQDAACPRNPQAVELEPQRSAEAFSRALRAQPDANVVLDKAMPQSAAVYLPILRLLSDVGDLDNAQIVWSRLIASRHPEPISEMVFYINALHSSKTRCRRYPRVERSSIDHAESAAARSG